MHVSVAYASETGAAEALAWRAAAWLALRGVQSGGAPEPLEAADARARDDDDVLLIFAATAGDGAPPAGCRAWWKALLRRDAPRRGGRRYALHRGRADLARWSRLCYVLQEDHGSGPAGLRA